ncbi:MAG: hypothetical protein QHH74_15435 [Spirochaetota bacterium]|nr:hypothetical protein [Spirochaetota bacterium]
MKITNNIVSAHRTHSSAITLKSGQIVIGTITKRLTANTAMVRVGNQIFETRFARGLPQSNHILLKFDTITGNRFIFSLVEPKALGNTDILSATPSNYALFMRNLNAIDSLTVFSIHKALFDTNANREYTFTVIAPLLQRLLQKGVPEKLLEKFCYTLSKDTGISLTMHILQNIGDSSLQDFELHDDDIESLMSMMSKDDIESLVQYLGDSSGNVFTVPLYDGNSFSDAYILSDDNYVCIDVTFSHLGKLNIMITQKDTIAATIYCFTDAAFSQLHQQCPIIARSIHEQTGKKAACSCIQRSDWEEKIIALINNMYIQYSIDFSV